MDSNRKRGGAPSKTASELVRLDAVALDEDDEILPDFEAEVEYGSRVWVTPGEPKVLVNRHRLLVNPRLLRVRHLASKEAARRGREAARQLRLQEHNPAA